MAKSPTLDDLKDLVKDFENFQNYTIEARALSERDQDYDDHHQWTDTEKDTLETRNQAPVVINRVKNKVNLLVGIQRRGRTQPRALPRTPQHADGADAITEGIRFVVDNTGFKMKSSAVFRDKCVPGYGGAIVEMEEDGKTIAVNKVAWDRYYYDPHSRELDFSDKKFDGIVIWTDKEDLIQMFPDKKEEIINLITRDDGSGNETFDDKPIRWVDRKRQRVRLCQHFFLRDGVWKMAFFTRDLFLMEPKDSPFKDEAGKPDNPIEMDTAYIDRDLQRYGEVRSYIWLQDEINHRRSRLLYAGSVNRTMGEDGAVDDVNVMKQELAKANGHIKVNPGFGDKFEILPNDAISETQLLLYRESKAEIDEIGANAALAGKSNARSGRQEQIQQQGGIAELASLYDGHKDWENRIYRQIWNRIKQHKSAEWWIRITDDAGNLEWVGLNQKITNGQILQLAAENGSEEAALALQQLQGDPRLDEIAETRNNVTEIDVDVVIVDSPDIHTLRQETVEGLLKLAERYGPESVPFSVALELSDLPNKDTVKKMLNPEVSPEVQQKQEALQQLIQSLEIADKEATVQGKQAKAFKDAQEGKAQAIENAVVEQNIPNLVLDKQLDTELKQVESIQKQVETTKLINEPTESVNVNV